MKLNIEDVAIEFDKWLRFGGLEHLGYISVGVTKDTFLVYWDKVRTLPSGMPKSFAGFPIELKRIGKPMPATS